MTIPELVSSWRWRFKSMGSHDLDGRMAIMQGLKSQIEAEERDPTEEEREAILEMVEEIEDVMELWQRAVMGECPIGFFKPSWEQAQILNAWSPEYEPDAAPNGYRSVCCYSANRIGKSAICVIDTLLWCLPNDPSWDLFIPHEDHLGRGTYQVLMRPDWERWHRRGRMVYPGTAAPPKGACEIWHGVGRDDDWHNKMWLEYKKWMPQKFYGTRTDGLRAIFKQEKRFETCFGHNIVGMSMNAESEAWAGKAAWRVNIDEGMTKAIMNEALTRITDGGYFHQSYTPADPANIGEKSRVAKLLYTQPQKYPLVGQAKFFVRFALKDAPDWIVPPGKRADDIKRFSAMGKEGKVRSEGGFFDTSPVVFSNFNRSLNVLPWTGQEIRERFKDGILLRGFDEGTANPSATVWYLLTRSNEWVAFQEWEQAGLSVSDRCTRVIELSGNTREIIRWAETEEARRYREVMGHMIIRKTYGDSKMFKRNPERVEDDWTDTYRKAGLSLEKAAVLPPKARCDYINDLLRPDPTRKHLLQYDPRYKEGKLTAEQMEIANGPGTRFYVSIECEKLIERLENYLWQQISTGPNKGYFTDKPEDKDDHIVDAACYVPISKYRWFDQSIVGQAAVPQQPVNSVTGY